jgi:predicted alpha/beta-fold hydrolase
MLLEYPVFRPHPLVRGGHLQTILGAYLPWQRVPYNARQHQVTLDDGDRIVLHDDQPQSWQPGDGVVLLLHGLGGSYQSSYMQRSATKLTERGYRVFRMDLRGYGAGFPLARYPVHAGRSEDAGSALAHVMELCPGSPVHLVGFSMGGNIVLKLAGELGSQAPQNLASVLAVSPPIDLVECSRNMHRRVNRVYDRRFVKNLLDLVQRRKQLVEGALHRAFATLPKRLVDFDDQYTAPLSGFAGAQDYYEQASSGRVLRHVSVPTLIVTAASDPIIPVGPFERTRYSDSTQLIIAPCGGHLGFFGRAGIDPDRRWLDWRIVDWIASRSPARQQPVQPVRRASHGVMAR